MDQDEFTVDEDVCLFDNRDCSVSSLSKHFNAQKRLIRQRLGDLCDRGNSARMRMDKYVSGGFGAKSSNHNKKRQRDCVGMPAAKRRRLNEVEPPEDLCDPITYKLMKEPTLVTLSGYTYEKKTIVQCVEENGKDPLTNIKIKMEHLVSNRALELSIKRWRQENEI